MGAKKYTRHHRKCKSRGGSDLPSNISMVTESQHCAWHTLFENKSAEQIIELINDVWIDPYYTLTLTRRNTNEPHNPQKTFFVKEQK